MTSKILATGGSAIALAAVLSSPALAGPTYTTGSGGEFTWYGQINQTFQSFDDGQETRERVLDNANSGSRLGFTVTQPLGENTLKFRFETSLGLRSTDGVNLSDSGDFMDWTRGNLRHVDIQWSSPTLGRLSVGQGSMAADGVTGIDMSGTGVVANTSVADAAGGYAFRETSGALSSIDIGDAFATFDGSRLGRVRYDTNSFAGFSVSASYGEDILTENSDKEAYDVAVNYAKDDLGDFSVSGALAVSWTENGSTDTRDTIASAAVLHKPTGLSLSIAGGDRDTGGTYGYAKIGYSADLLSVGATSLSVDYYSGSDMISTNDSADSFGVAAVQKFDKQNVEAYLAYREYSYEDTSASYQDSQVLLAGARWKF